MKKMNLAYTYEDDSEYYGMSPADVVRAIFAAADDDGVVCLEELADLTVDEPEEDKYLRCRLKDRSEGKVAEIVELLDYLLRKFKKISVYYDQLIGYNDMEETIGDDEETLSVWAAYVKDYSSDDPSENEEEAGTRLDGRRIKARNLIATARRICKLLYLNAPPIIIENEEKHFAEVLVLNLAAESVEEIKK